MFTRMTFLECANDDKIGINGDRNAKDSIQLDVRREPNFCTK